MSSVAAQEQLFLLNSLPGLSCDEEQCLVFTDHGMLAVIFMMEG